MLARVLVVETDPLQRETLAMSLSLEGYQPILAENAEEAFAALRSRPIDLVLCALENCDADGRELMPRLARHEPHLPIILTAEADRLKLAEAAIERGAYGALQKPVERADLVLLLQRAHELKRLQALNNSLRGESERSVGHPIVAASEPMIELLENLERATDHGGPVLMIGESGTGKAAIARVLHEQSGRGHAPFVRVDCRAWSNRVTQHENQPRDQAMGQLGHLWSAAAGGTLYLEAVQSIPLEDQSQLFDNLRARIRSSRSEDPAFQAMDVQVLASASPDLQSEIEAGRFSRELAGALSGLILRVPPLRERRQDIPLLVDHFVERLAPELAPHVRGVGEEALAQLTQYPCPGNVRELESVMTRAMMLSTEERITLLALPGDLSDHNPSSDSATSLKSARRIFETEMIRSALRATGGNRTHAAKHLEISHRALLYKLKEYGIRD